MKQSDEKYCESCGEAIKIKAIVCPKCGVPQRMESTKSRMTTALLAFLFGGLGVHRFYLGQNGKGFLYLLFCWTFIPAIIALIDCIIFIMQSDEKFAEKYK